MSTNPSTRYSRDKQQFISNLPFMSDKELDNLQSELCDELQYHNLQMDLTCDDNIYRYHSKAINLCVMALEHVDEEMVDRALSAADCKVFRCR